MISVNSMKRPMIGGQPYDFEFKGLSTDTKPSTWGGNDVGVNSLFFEQDTGDFYYLKQQGSESQGDLIYEGTLSDWTFYDWANAYAHSYDLTESQILGIVATSTIKVIWNGVPYICQSRPSGDDGNVEFGATYGDSGYDFSDYPFYINTYAEDFVLTFTTSTDDEVNVEIYQYSSVDAVWAKIGEGGGDEPLFEVTIAQDEWLDNGGNGGYVTNDDYQVGTFPQSIVVEWNGTKYNCSLQEGYYYGAGFDGHGSHVFTDYPFQIEMYVDEPQIGECCFYAETDEEVIVKIYA